MDLELRELARRASADPSAAEELARAHVRMGLGWRGETLPPGIRVGPKRGEYLYEDTELAYVPAGSFADHEGLVDHVDHGYWIARRPIGEFTWAEARELCEHHPGLAIPTELEWERAALGDGPAPERGASSFGIYELNGELSEWCDDVRLDEDQTEIVENMLAFADGAMHPAKGGPLIEGALARDAALVTWLNEITRAAFRPIVRGPVEPRSHAETLRGVDVRGLETRAACFVENESTDLAFIREEASAAARAVGLPLRELDVLIHRVPRTATIRVEVVGLAWPDGRAEDELARRLSAAGAAYVFVRHLDSGERASLALYEEGELVHRDVVDVTVDDPYERVRSDEGPIHRLALALGVDTGALLALEGADGIRSPLVAHSALSLAPPEGPRARGRALDVAREMRLDAEWARRHATPNHDRGTDPFIAVAALAGFAVCSSIVLSVIVGRAASNELAPVAFAIALVGQLLLYYAAFRLSGSAARAPRPR